MKIAVLKKLVDAGACEGVAAIPAALEDGWNLVMKSKNGEYEALEAARGGARLFKTLDSINKEVKALGLEGFFVSITARDIP